MKRYSVLIASVLIQTCLGGIYAWSAFASALYEQHGISMGRIQLIFGVCYVSFPVTMVFAGRIQERHGPRITAAIGGLLLGAGYVIASLSGGDFPIMLCGIGVVGGAGIGFGYVCPIAASVRWFPEHKGIVTGLAVAGFGGGAVLLSAIGDILLARGFDILDVFHRVGLAYGGAIVVCATLLFVPYGSGVSRERVNIPVTELLRDRRYWMLFLGILAGTFTGLSIVGNLKPIGLAGGSRELLASIAISSLAVGNASGRIVWGWISDRIHERTIPFSLAFLGLSVLALIPASHLGGVFIAVAFCVGFSFGACFVLYAAAVAQFYGKDAIGAVYPLVFLAVAISGTLGPATGGWLFDVTGNYNSSLILAAALSGCGAVTCGLLQRKTP